MTGSKAPCWRFEGEQEVESSRSGGDYAPGALYGVHGAGKDGRCRMEGREGAAGAAEGGRDGRRRKWRAACELRFAKDRDKPNPDRHGIRGKKEEKTQRARRGGGIATQDTPLERASAHTHTHAGAKQGDSAPSVCQRNGIQAQMGQIGWLGGSWGLKPARKKEPGKGKRPGPGPLGGWVLGGGGRRNRGQDRLDSAIGAIVASVFALMLLFSVEMAAGGRSCVCLLAGKRRNGQQLKVCVVGWV